MSASPDRRPTADVFQTHSVRIVRKDEPEHQLIERRQIDALLAFLSRAEEHAQ